MEFMVTFRLDYFIFALAVLFAFGLWYNKWVEDQMAGGFDQGFMSFIVALGCFITLALGLFGSTLNIYVFIIALGAFIASGLPMIRGSIQRFNKARTEKRMEEKAETTKRLILEEDRRPLSKREQALMEGVMAGLIEGRQGFDLAREMLLQFYDPVYARDNGDDDEEFVDRVGWAIGQMVRKQEAK